MMGEMSGPRTLSRDTAVAGLVVALVSWQLVTVSLATEMLVTTEVLRVVP